MKTKQYFLYIKKEGKPGDSQACIPGANNTLYANKKLKNFKN